MRAAAKEFIYMYCIVLLCDVYDLSCDTWLLVSMRARRPEKHLSTSFLWYLCLLTHTYSTTSQNS